MGDQDTLNAAAVELCRKIHARTLKPEDGASQIWHLAGSRIELGGDLLALFRLAAAWHDRSLPKHRLRKAIRSEAKAVAERGYLRKWIRVAALHRRSPVQLPPRYEDVDLDDLPISASLRTALGVWASDHDDVVARPRGGPGGFFSKDAALDFAKRGAALADKLQAELGDRWHVDYEEITRQPKVEPQIVIGPLDPVCIPPGVEGWETDAMVRYVAEIVSGPDTGREVYVVGRVLHRDQIRMAGTDRVFDVWDISDPHAIRLREVSSTASDTTDGASTS